MKKHFSPLFAVLLVVCLTLAASCSKKEEKKVDVKEGEMAAEQVFTFSNGTEPETLDPHKGTGIPEGNIAYALFEGLLTLDHETLKPLPGVAERWEISGDGLTYTFHLRKNARWSNGDTVDARDFAYSYERALRPETAAEYASMLWYIKNAKPYNAGELKDFSRVGVRVIDDFTISLELVNPTPFFLDVVAFHTLLPVNKEAVEKHGDQWTRPGKIVTNGPFLLVDWKPRDRVVLVKNPDYWDAENVFLEKINVLATEEETTYFNMYGANETEWIRTIPLQQIPRLKKEGRKDVYLTPFIGIYYYLLNTTRKPLDDKRVRRALNMAINKEKLCKYIMTAGEQPADSFVPRIVPGYTPPKGLPYDPEKARALLAEAGYPGGKGFPKLSILFNTSDAHKMIAEVIQSDWKENLNISVDIENKEWKVYLSERQAKNYDIARAGWIGDYIDPKTFLELFESENGLNHTGWGTKRYDDLITKANRTLDLKKREKIFQEAERFVMTDEMPVIPIYYYVNKNMLKPWVKNFYFNIRDFHTFKGVYIAPH
ncbi:MAG: peptide ABC transporter substrate-binding protein [bacterium]